MMLGWLGERQKAMEIELAVADVVERGNVRTYDMGGSATTKDMARAVVQILTSGQAAVDSER
jgi:isocitrate/isopropylmalate dehydrogenase